MVPLDGALRCPPHRPQRTGHLRQCRHCFAAVQCVSGGHVSCNQYSVPVAVMFSASSTLGATERAADEDMGCSAYKRLRTHMRTPTHTHSFEHLGSPKACWWLSRGLLKRRPHARPCTPAPTVDPPAACLDTKGAAAQRVVLRRPAQTHACNTGECTSSELGRLVRASSHSRGACCVLCLKELAQVIGLFLERRYLFERMAACHKAMMVE